MADLTIERLHAVLNYNPETGTFIWRKQLARRAPAGTIAGNLQGNERRKYIRITIDGKHYHAHRLIWFYIYGVWPRCQIDHKNGNSIDNRLENLREATDSQNQANRKGPNKNNRSGFKGVYWDTPRSRWAANIWKDRKKFWLGYFDTPQGAHAAYRDAAVKLHGEFANLG